MIALCGKLCCKMCSKTESTTGLGDLLFSDGPGAMSIHNGLSTNRADFGS